MYCLRRKRGNTYMNNCTPVNYIDTNMVLKLHQISIKFVTGTFSCFGWLFRIFCMNAFASNNLQSEKQNDGTQSIRENHENKFIKKTNVTDATKIPCNTKFIIPYTATIKFMLVIYNYCIALH